MLKLNHEIFGITNSEITNCGDPLYTVVRLGYYSVDSIKRTVHLAFHGLFSLLKILFTNRVNSIFNRDFLKFYLATVLLIEQYA